MLPVLVPLLRRDGELDLSDAEAELLMAMSAATIDRRPAGERAAVAEAARVLRPGGRFVAVEHVGSRHLLVRSAQRVLDPLLVRLQGDHLLRQPSQVASSLGLRLVLRRRSRLGVVERLVAEKPG